MDIKWVFFKVANKELPGCNIERLMGRNVPKAAFDQTSQYLLWDIRQICAFIYNSTNDGMLWSGNSW